MSLILKKEKEKSIFSTIVSDLGKRVYFKKKKKPEMSFFIRHKSVKGVTFYFEDRSYVLLLHVSGRSGIATRHDPELAVSPT